jgi:hypothetical protein
VTLAACQNRVTIDGHFISHTNLSARVISRVYFPLNSKSNYSYGVEKEGYIDVLSTIWSN